MTYAKRWWWLVAAGAATLIGGAACSNALADDSTEAARGGNPTPNGSDGSSNGSSSSSGGLSSGTAPQQGPTATGVVIVHAAVLPAIRLCFGNLLDQLPQPDAKVMPEANVVGVEMGSLIRIDPIVAPGTIYIFREQPIRSQPNATCKQLLSSAANLTKNLDYFEAGKIDTPLGQSKVSVLAVTGCGPEVFLDALNVDSTKVCSPTFKADHQTSGEIQVEPIDLTTAINGATDKSLPVQLFQLSSAIANFEKTAKLNVTFGELAKTGALDQSVPSETTLFGSGTPQTLNVDLSVAATYGTYGFRVNIPGAPAPSIDQSLATVQDLSSSTDLPTTYYGVASNYALLLVGDPTHQPSLTDGGANPNYNARQAVHLLAIPVLDPSRADAGAPDSGTTTSSSGSAGDGG